MASIATDELEPPALLCGFGGKCETVDFIAQAVASINFEPPVQSCGFGSEREVNAEDLRNRDVVVDAPSPRPPPMDALPSTPSGGGHNCCPPTPAEVDGDVEDAGANSAVKDDNVGSEGNAGEFLAMELIQRPTRQRRQQCPQVIVQRIVPRSIYDDTKTMATKSCGRLI